MSVKLRKKVCVDLRMAFHSGIGTYIRNILPFLRQSEMSLQVLAPLSHVKAWPALQDYDVIPLEAPIYSIREQIELPFKIPACDLFWATHYNIPLAPIRAKKRLTSIHDVYHLAHGAWLGLRKRSYAQLMLPSAARISDHVITISQFSKNEIMRWTSLEEQKISIVHLGVDPSHFKWVEQEALLQRVKRLYDLPDHYILYVGNLAVHKNLSRLLQAWQLVHPFHRGYKLVLVGKENRKQPFSTAILRNPHLQECVIPLGFVEEAHVPLLYQLAQGFIFPSLYEGFGLPPLEAMRMGCPTIVSNAASLPEVCQGASLYIDPYNVEDIAKKISRLIENPHLRQTLIEKGVEHAKQFSWEKTACKHLEIMEGMMR